MAGDASFNPFPGLRPFEADEDHLFFGREKQIDELLRRMRNTRFLTVVGTSGSGKSSLVRSGLIPSLYSGFMSTAGSTWRVSIFRPGEDPIRQMAAALSLPGSLGRTGELADMSRVLVETTLRRGTLGLVEAVREARIPPDENILVVVDQFEELFRFRRNREMANPRNEAVAFVKLLIEAAGQEQVPIYVALTMRSDFIGDCMQYPGLPEAVNAGQYLVPRMTRDQLRSAITGPVAVGGGEIAPRLVVRLLNDVNDDPDQLPVLQHSLMRTWEYWKNYRQSVEPMDIAHYEAIGTMQRALSLHAEEAYAEADSAAQKQIAERSFKALTDTFTDPRGIRRPTSVRELAAVCEAAEADVMAVVELFRRPGRSFLMPPAAVQLESQSIVDISHESVMRCWERLIGWAEQERTSAGRYVRLSRAAAWYEEGTTGLWRDPELEMGLQWRQKNRPNAAWAARYDSSFDRAMEFLDRSRDERDRLIAERDRLAAERERDRRKQLRQFQWGAGILAALLVIVGALGVIAFSERNRAEHSLRSLREVVGQMVKFAGGDSARVAADVPQVEALRKQMADTARKFYVEFLTPSSGSEESRRWMADAHFRLGDINRILQDSGKAIEEYTAAIEQLQGLAKDYPGKPDYQQILASAYNWLGESERPTQQGHADADRAYNRAVALQEALIQMDPGNRQYRQELARTHYNRGIARFEDGRIQEAEADDKAAIDLLEPLQENPQSRQELARAYNNLATLLKTQKRPEDARRYQERAIAIHETLRKQFPENRDYALELAKFHQNLGILFQSQKPFKLAEHNNQVAMKLYEELASPVPLLVMNLADAHTLRGRISEFQGDRARAAREYQQAIDMFGGIETSKDSGERPEFHLRYGDSLMYLGNLWYSDQHPERAVALLLQAAKQHSDARARMNLCYDYYKLTEAYLKLGSTNEAVNTLSKLSNALNELPEADRASYEGTLKDLQKRIDKSTSGRNPRDKE